MIIVYNQHNTTNLCESFDYIQINDVVISLPMIKNSQKLKLSLSLSIYIYIYTCIHYFSQNERAILNETTENYKCLMSDNNEA
jgi:hypothetical protein